MLQASIQCPIRYQKLYVEKVQTQGKWFNATFVGSVVHKCIEIHDNDEAKLQEEMWAQVGEFFPIKLMHTAIKLMAQQNKAIEATQVEGAKWGNVYKAPEMTGY